MQPLLANRDLCFLFNDLQSVSHLEARMVLMKENRPLQMTLSGPPSAHSFPHTVYPFHSSQSDFLKTFIPFPRSFQQLLTTLRMKSKVLPVALDSSLLSDAVSPPLSRLLSANQSLPHCSSHRPGCSFLRAFALALSLARALFLHICI